MTEDDRFFRDVFRHCDDLRRTELQEAREKRASAPNVTKKHRYFSGAAVFGSRLIVSTLTLNSYGEFSFVDDRSGSIELKDHNQSALFDFSDRLRRFLRSAAVSQVMLRMSPPKGPYRTGALGYKMEAALQLLLETAVETIMPQSVTAFVSRHVGELPTPKGVKSRQELQAFDRASGAAAYAALGGSEIPLAIEALFGRG